MELLTGKTRLRPVKIGSALILQCEVRPPLVTDRDGNLLPRPTYWRDATVEDLTELHALTFGEVRIVLTMREAGEYAQKQTTH